MNGQIVFDGEQKADVRVIGKVNLVLTLYKEDKYVAQVNMRKARGHWTYKVKKLAPEYMHGGNWASVHDKEFIGKVEEFLCHYQAERILLT